MMASRSTSAASISVLAATALASAGLIGCGGQAGEPGDAMAGMDQAAAPGRIVNVEIAPVVAAPFTEAIRLTGAVRASREVMVAAEESGVIREIFVDKGALVAEGQAIAKIDDRVLAAQVSQATAAAALAEQTWERRRRLFEEDQVGSELAYLQARAEWEQAQANLDAMAERLDRTTVTAPFAGTLDALPIELGTMVAPGVSVARIVDMNPVEIVGAVPERFAPDVRPGIRARVTFQVFPGEEFSGTIGFVGATVDPASRTFPIELTLPNPGRSIKPEMIAEIVFPRRQIEDAIAIPQEALVRVEEGFVAFVIEDVEGQPTARARSVVTGPAQSNRVVIEAGIRAGDRLVVVGQAQVADGDRVRIVGDAGSARGGR